MAVQVGQKRPSCDLPALDGNAFLPILSVRCNRSISSFNVLERLSAHFVSHPSLARVLNLLEATLPLFFSEWYSYEVEFVDTKGSQDFFIDSFLRTLDLVSQRIDASHPHESVCWQMVRPFCYAALARSRAELDDSRIVQDVVVHSRQYEYLFPPESDKN
jgi:hypothetical protein